MSNSRFELRQRLKLSAAGYCIYCGDTYAELTTEHIVPYGLGGKLELPEASCEKCRKITQKFEETCMRGMFFEYRVRSGYPSKHRKEWPSSFDIETIDQEGGFEKSQILASEYPRVLTLMMYPIPGILRGRDPAKKIEQTVWFSVSRKDARKLGAFRVKGDFDSLSFCRMLAKIGHSYAAGILGKKEFSDIRPLLCDLIRSGTEPPFHLVGTDASIPPVVSTEPSHTVSLVLSSHANRQFLVASIRLFAHLGAPLYHAVIGEWPKDKALPVLGPFAQ